MAKIIETSTKRRLIRMSTDDVLSVISQYQTITNGIKNYDFVRNLLNNNTFYIPEDV